MTRIKEHAINKINLVVSVTKFEIMRSGAKVITIISLPGKEVVKSKNKFTKNVILISE